VNLTIEQLSKLTKLSVPTLRVYVTRKKLGRRVGKSRVFSQADVQKLLKTSKGSNGKTRAKPKTPRVRTSKGRLNSKPNKRETVDPKVVQPKNESPNLESKKKGFWSSLFGGRKPKAKVNLLEVKTRK
jgi:hypothetical protein